MKAYLDASVIIPLLLDDPFTTQAEALLRIPDLHLITSDLAVLEVSNVVARRVRIQALSKAEASTTLADFDLWRSRAALGAETIAADVAVATGLVRRFDLALRGPDALHLAITQRLDCVLFTFDAQMAAAATALGLAVV